VGGRPSIISDDELLDVARTVLLERGVDATTSEIAKRARISESVIFYRYRTKDEFIRALLERELVVPPVVAQLAAKAGQGAVADNLFDAAMALLEVSRRVQPLIMIAAARSASYGSHHRYAAQHPVRREIARAAMGYFEAEIEQGRLRAVSAQLLARMFVGAIVQLVAEERMDSTGSTEDVPAFVRGMIDVLLQATRPDSASET
jgi:AcrR family transcriptional regulator